MHETETGRSAGPLAGKRVALTGRIDRGAARRAIERAGGTVAERVDRECDVLVAGPEAGSRLARARACGVLVVDGATFAASVEGDCVRIALRKGGAA